MLGTDDDTAGFAALSTWLGSLRISETNEATQLAMALVARVASSSELTHAEQLAAAAGLGLRALQRLFRDHVGASPKWVIRRNRLQEVASRLEHGQSVKLARLAAELGYADQAHLTRDFKSATGKTPSEFARVVGAQL